MESDPNYFRGFALIEILVVMVIIGLLAGVALPRLYTLSHSFELASQRQNILAEIANLGYRAYNTGQPIKLTALPQNGAASAPIQLPSGWKLDVPAPVHYQFNGLCGGGRLSLVNPQGHSENFQLKPPLCQPEAATP